MILMENNNIESNMSKYFNDFSESLIEMNSERLFDAIWTGAWTRNRLSGGIEKDESVGFITNEGGWLYSNRIGTVADVLEMTYEDFVKKFSHLKEVGSDHNPYEGQGVGIRLGSDVDGYQDVVDNDMWCFVMVYA
jgi:hypothetical protein